VGEGVLKFGMCCLAGSENVRSFSDTSLAASVGLFHAGVVSSLGKVSDPVKRKECIEALAVTPQSKK
jgi:hypothetical protein